MSDPITFSFDYWIAGYPEFAGCSAVQGQAWFDRATMFLPNADVFCNPNMLQAMLYLLTSHIAFLNAPRDALGNPAQSGSPPPNVVGRISSASEGSVSVQTEWEGSGSPSEAWYLQTRYGAEYWQAMAPYRTAHYVAQPNMAADRLYPWGAGFYAPGRRGW